MGFLQSWGGYFWAAVTLALIAVWWTIRVFRRRRNFEPGPGKGVAANPAQVRRENPPHTPR